MAQDQEVSCPQLQKLAAVAMEVLIVGLHKSFLGVADLGVISATLCFAIMEELISPSIKFKTAATNSFANPVILIVKNTTVEIFVFRLCWALLHKSGGNPP